MRRHVINVQAYNGRTIQLAIGDISDGGWGAAYFDDIQVGVNLNQGFKVETLAQAHVNGTTYRPVYTDYFINSAQIKNETNPYGLKYNNAGDAVADTTAAKEAHDFLQYYYSTFRAQDSFKYINCDFTGEELQDLCDNYDDLSDDAETIVNASMDYNRGNSAAGNWYEKEVLTNRTVGQTVGAIISKYNLTHSVPNPSAFGKITQSGNMTTIMVVVVVSSLIALAFALLLGKKRKHN